MKISNLKKQRIKELTKEGLSISIIAERLGIATSQVHYHQKKLGIYKPSYKKRKKTEGLQTASLKLKEK